MVESLAQFLNQAEQYAPLIYISLFLMTALLPFIPTPLVSALGGSMLGAVPASLYGIIGLALGALLALNLSRFLGRPVMVRLVGAKTWEEWEHLLGIRSTLIWGLIFFVLNIDFAVVAAGLSGLPLRKLWITAVIARTPWVIISAWFGETIAQADQYLPYALLLLVAGFIFIRLARPRIRHLLIQQRLKDEARRARRIARREAQNQTRQDKQALKLSRISPREPSSLDS